MIRCVALDFDGTVLLSNEIKRQSFFETVSSISAGYDAMAAILAREIGDRYEVFDIFAAETGLSAKDLVDNYSVCCEEKILVCPERHGAERVIPQMRELGIKVYLNSATPVMPLRGIVSGRFGANFFDGVYGNNGQKAKNLETVLTNEAIQPKELVMIGDGADDWEAALNVGCRFIGVPDGTLAAGDYDGPILDNFDDILKCLKDGFQVV